MTEGKFVYNDRIDNLFIMIEWYFVYNDRMIIY